MTNNDADMVSQEPHVSGAIFVKAHEQGGHHVRDYWRVPHGSRVTDGESDKAREKASAPNSPSITLNKKKSRAGKNASNGETSNPIAGGLIVSSEPLVSINGNYYNVAEQDSGSDTSNDPSTPSEALHDADTLVYNLSSVTYSEVRDDEQGEPYLSINLDNDNSVSVYTASQIGGDPDDMELSWEYHDSEGDDAFPVFDHPDWENHGDANELTRQLRILGEEEPHDTGFTTPDEALRDADMTVWELPNVKDTDVREDPLGNSFLRVDLSDGNSLSVYTASQVGGDPNDMELTWLMRDSDGATITPVTQGWQEHGDADELKRQLRALGKS